MRKEDLLHIWLLQYVALYRRRYKIRSYNTIEFLDTHVFINNPNWQSSGIIIFLCPIDIVISDALVSFFLDVLFFFMRNQEGIKVELQKKVHLDEFFDCIPSFLCHILLPSLSTTLEWPNKYIYCNSILCDIKNVKISWNLIPACWHL